MNTGMSATPAGPTPGPWQQGFLISTPNTRRWPIEQRRAQDDLERRMVFANFRASDQGRGRRLVGTFDNPADAKLAAAAWDMLEALRYVRNLIGPDPIVDGAIELATSEA